MSSSTMVLDVDAIQGVVLRGYRMPVACHVFLRFGPAAAARDWIAGLIGHITTGAPWESKPDSTVNIAFTAAGLRALGLADREMDSFSTPFVQGMAARAELLGDDGPSAPTEWTGGLGTEQVHAMVWLQALTPPLLQARISWLDETMRAGGVTVVSAQDAALLPGGAEHFGYVDGYSQPVIEGVDPANRTGGSRYDRGGGQTLRAGEIVLGYPDEEGVLPQAPQPDDLSRNASYLVYRKLRQDVVGFRTQLSEAARHYGEGEEKLAAKILGRWRDGTPLDVCPDGPDPALVADQDRNNAFSYADDPDGYRCPVGAHIRRANPRLSLPFDGKLVKRHRLVRRGLSYGPALPPEAADDGADRGVLFLCLQADLARQFEFVQSQWINDGFAFGLGHDKDVLVGAHDGTGKATINGAPPYFVSPLRRTVTVAGGEYLFMPGINGLHYLTGITGSGHEARPRTQGLAQQ